MSMHLTSEASRLGLCHPRCADDGVDRVAVQPWTSPRPGANMEPLARLGEPLLDEVPEPVLFASSRDIVADRCTVGHLVADQSPIVTGCLGRSR